MTIKTKRILLLLLSVCLLSGLLGCTDRTQPVQTVVATTAPTPPATAVLAENGSFFYQIVLQEDAGASAECAAARLSEALGQDFVSSSEADGQRPWIYLEVAQELSADAHPMDYRVCVKEDSIHLTANHASALANAAEHFLANLHTDTTQTAYLGAVEHSYSYAASNPSPYGIVGYDFFSKESGRAGGEIILYPKTLGVYSFYWANGEGKLSGYTEFVSEYAFAGEVLEVFVQEFTAIPPEATHVVAERKGEVVSVYELPTERCFRGAQLYSFGAISDTHQGTRYGAPSIPYEHFVSAAKQLSDMGASMIGICGDISYANEESEYVLHANAVREIFNYAPKMPIYTVSGNHESKYTGFSKDWFFKYSRNVVNYDSALKPLFSDGNDLDFVIELPDGSVMIYLNQVYYDYGKKTSRLLDDYQLDWLGARLEQYRDRTVFLFFHTFLDGEAGDASTSNGKEYSLPLIEGTVDHTRLSEYLSKYRNVIYFSGHSHQSFDLQFMKDKEGNNSNLYTNVDNNGGTFATMVHIPSVAAPRTGVSLSDDATRSEGYLVRVYEDRVIFEGYDFINGQTLAYAYYVIGR